MTISRRKFLYSGALGVAGICLSSYEELMQPAWAQSSNNLRSLVCIQLCGGNDGLNTVVPYANSRYYEARPTLAIAEEQVLKINNELGFHPSLKTLHEQYNRGDVAIVQSVGYPRQNRSHYRSSEIWHSAFPDKLKQTSWLKRYADAYSDHHIEEPLRIAEMESSVSLSDQLQSISASITSDVRPSPVYFASMEGFDTHANQFGVHAFLLEQLSDSLAIFQSDLQTKGKADRVLTLIFSEFGRRVPENGGAGTDHGSAQPIILIGPKLNGGVYGEHASLTELDAGDLRHNIDFRSVYATLLRSWFGADDQLILHGQFPLLKFV